MRKVSADPESRHRSTGMTLIQWLSLGLVMAVALALRLWRLDRAPLWWDEGNNAYFAHQTLSRLVEMSHLTHDTDPPAHRMACGLWLAIWGDSAYNLRSLSVFCNVLTLPLIYLWGRWHKGHTAGLVAAALMAISPMAIYYSRQAKAYTMVTLFTTASLVIWMIVLDRSERFRPLPWLGYVLCNLLAIGSHYYVALLIAAQGLWLVLSIMMGPRQRAGAWRRLLTWGSAQLVTLAAMAPWLWMTWNTAVEGARHIPGERTALSPLIYLYRTLGDLAAGPETSRVLIIASLVILIGLCLYELIKGRGKRQGILWLSIHLPTLLGFVAQTRITFFSARFLLYVLPPVCLLAALAMVRLKRIGAVVGLLLAIAWGMAIPHAYRFAETPREDLRPMASILSEKAQPGDALIVSYIWQEGILQMYAPELPVHYYLGWYASDNIPSKVGAMLQQHRRIWVANYRAPIHHGTNPVSWWLLQNSVRAYGYRDDVNRLTLFVPPCEMSGEQSASFEKDLTLAFGQLPAQVRQGELLCIPLRWTVTDPPPVHHFSVFVHILDETGALRAQHDGAPGNGLRPFREMEPDTWGEDARMIMIEEELPPGRYSVRVGVYIPKSGERLAVIEGPDAGTDGVTIGHLEIVERSPDP